MIRKYLLAILAVVGVLIIVAAIILDNGSKPTAAPLIEWPKVPFASYVAGTGILEAGSGNIAVGTGTPGVVTDIYVKWGDQVKVGAPLFKTDERDLQAQRLAALATVKEAEAKVMQARDQLKLINSVPDRRAVSTEEVNGRRSTLAIAETVLGSAQARVAQFNLDIERRVVRALVPGKILQINIRPGEFAQSGALAKPLMLVGSDDRFYLRVDVDEFDAARIRPGAAAVAFVRGATARETGLRFERIEPYIAAKTALNGTGTERVDTRVLQVIYSFEHSALPAYIGQQMDVYIEAAMTETARQVGPDARAARRGESAP